MSPRETARRPIDWADAKRRVEAAAGVTYVATTSDQTRRVLEERARLLARTPAAPDAGGTIEVITFSLAKEVYAVETRYVFEVFKLTDLTPLPGAEPPIFGITAWRGELLTIVDLRSALGVPVHVLNDLSRVIVVGDDQPACGILADAVHDLKVVPVESVGPLPQGIQSRRELVRGITGDAVLVLESSKLLHLAESDQS